MSNIPMLELRAEALRMNLDNLETHLKKARNPGQDLRECMEEIRKIHRSLEGPSIATVNSAIRLTGTITDQERDEIRQGLRNAHDTQEELREKLRKACDSIEKLMGEYSRVQDTEAVKTGIAEDLAQRTQPQIDSLDDLPQDSRNGWAKFLATAEKTNNSIFSQYIELLGGLALRDIGFDAGTSKLADELLSACMETKKPMVTIPTRQKAMTITLGRVVRVTFPDWTIWALPATAFEFWHVVAQKELAGTLRAQLRRTTRNNAVNVEARLQNCLGDAFATYMMGPAYAYYAILLLLNPAAPYADNDGMAADEVRASSIIEMLTWMDQKREKGGDNPLFKKIRNELSEAWKEAVAQAYAVQDSEEQKKKHDQELRQVQTDLEVMKNHVQAQWEMLSVSRSLPFTDTIWADIKGWVAPLLNKEVGSIQIPLSPELRHVLNAAWLARMEPERKGRMNLQDLTDAARELAKRVSKPMKAI